MVYNNGFPETYQNGYPQNNFPNYGYAIQAPQYGQPQYQQVTQTQQPIQQNQNNQQQSNSIIWVQGEAGAKAYPLAPNNKILLMDSENPVLYVKSVNASGIPDPLIIYDLVQRSDEPVQKNQSDERLNSIEERLKKIENRLQNNMNNSKQRRERNDG